MRVFAWAVAMLVGAACGSPGQFQCADADQCGADGLCEADGNCSFPDDTCPSGRRYGSLGSAGLAGTCVGTASTTTETDTAAASSTSSGGSPTTAADTLALDDTAGASTSAGAETGTTGTTGGPPVVDFFDDFERPDSDEIGNGWWEKTPTAFVIEGGRVARVGSADEYPDNLVLRPPEESFADVELTITVLPLAVDIGYPQLHARVQPDDVDVPSQVTGYIVYTSGFDTLLVTRQEQGMFADQISVPIVDPLDPSTPFRLRMSVAGQDPVVVDGYLETLDANDVWTVHTEIHYEDISATRITADGQLGFSASDLAGTLAYDDFGYSPQ